MKIYLDYIFLENLVVNIVIIVETIIFTKSKVSSKRKIIVIILDTVLSCVYSINSYLNKYLFHFIFTLIVLFILFKPKNIISLLKKTGCFYMLYFLYLGLIIFSSLFLNINLELFVNRILIYSLSGVVFHFICKDLWKVWKSNIRSRDLYYILCINNVKLNAFVDTGNTVKDPLTSLNVIFVNKDLKDICISNDTKSDKIYININTVNGNDVKEGYVVENVDIYKGKNKVAKLDKIILSFTLNSNTPEKYSAILGYDTYLENLQGVIL